MMSMIGKVFIAGFTLVVLILCSTPIATGEDGRMPGGMMGGMMEGMGMRGMRGMMGMKGMRACPMMSRGVRIEVRKLKDGVAISYRSDDNKTVKRLQIMGEMMKLMGEMMELESDE